jgi:DNA-binding transcriptional ArsR family regulator
VLKEATVSQALRLLRRRGAVVADRDGRLVRHALADDHFAALVKVAEPGAKTSPGAPPGSAGGPRSGPALQPIVTDSLQGVGDLGQHAGQFFELFVADAFGQLELIGVDGGAYGLVFRNAAWSREDQHAAAVFEVTVPVDEVVGDHPVDQLGERGTGQQDEVFDLIHRPAAAVCEQPKYPPLRKLAVVRAQHGDQAPSHPILDLAE